MLCLLVLSLKYKKTSFDNEIIFLYNNQAVF